MERDRPPQRGLFILAVVVLSAVLFVKWRKGMVHALPTLPVTSAPGGARDLRGPDGATIGYAYGQGATSDHSETYTTALGQLEREDYEGAEATYRRLVTLEPEKPEPHYGLGGALVRQFRYAEARTHYERALAVDARSVAALHGLGICRVGEKDDAAAVTFFDRALAIDPRDTPTIFSATSARVRLGQCAEAQALARRGRDAEGAVDGGAGRFAWNEALEGCRDGG